MEPNSREFYKQCAFQKFCNTVLHNEACDTHRELRRHKAKEVTFSDMTLDEARQLHTFDEYFKREAAETVFEKAGKKITPKLLLEAIRTLPEEKRKAILLYYFEGMNDTEIAELFNTSRSTIQYRRTSSFEKLTAAERPQRRERWRGTHTSSEGSAIMIHTVAMLSRCRRYCQQCGTGSGSCFQQPGRWFALISGK